MSEQHNKKDNIIVFPVKKEKPCVLEVNPLSKEGEGRYFKTGGFLCDLCPYCRGTKNWCPVKE